VGSAARPVTPCWAPSLRAAATGGRTGWHALPDRLRGSGFGLLGLVQAGGDLVACAVVGLLWATVSPTAGFAYAAAWMVASLLAVLLMAIPRR
jgi:hypothetical protein